MKAVAVTVGDRIQSMIDHMDKGEIELALSDVCIAMVKHIRLLPAIRNS